MSFEDRGVWFIYTTTCPQCLAHTVQGTWTRDDVIYEDCEICGYRGRLAVMLARCYMDEAMQPVEISEPYQQPEGRVRQAK